MNDPMKVKLLFNLDEDLKVEWIKTTSSNPRISMLHPC